MANYYLDLDGGNDGAAGTAIGTAWLTLGKLEGNVSGGDKVYVRANTSQTVAADINWTFAGSAGSSIEIIGCDSVVNDPWSDGSDVLPLIDFNGGAYYLYMNGCDFVTMNRIHFLNSHHATGMLYARYMEGFHCVDCTWEDGYRWAMYLNNGCASFEGCTFTNCGEYSTSRGSISTSNCYLIFNDCSIDSYSTDRRGLDLMAADAFLSECTFAQHGMDIHCGLASEALVKNCTFNASPTITVDSDSFAAGKLVPGVPPRYNGVLCDGWDFDGDALERGHQWDYQRTGEIDSDADYARSGGASQGFRFQSNANCDVDRPLAKSHFIYCDDTDAHTYTMYAQFQSGDPFSGDLDETELYFEVVEYKADGSVAVSTPGSTTWDYDDYSTWQTQTVSHTANAAGVLRIDIYLKTASGTAYIDPKITVT